jgi:hypothetical protein
MNDMTYDELHAEAQTFVDMIRRRHPERLRFLATGFIAVIECSMGGHCRCGKSMEQRDALFGSDRLHEALQHHADTYTRHRDAMEERLLEQIKVACPLGHVIDDAIIDELCEESGDDVILRELWARARGRAAEELPTSER